MNVKEEVGKLYENFIMRDLTYISSGALLLIILYECFSNEILNLNFKIILYPTSKLDFMLFFLISYFLGIIAQEILTLNNPNNCVTKKIQKVIFRTKPNTPNNENYLKIISMVESKYGNHTLRSFERTIFLKHIFTALGSTSVICFGITLLSLCIHGNPKDLLLLIISFVLFIICKIQYHNKIKLQEEQLKALYPFDNIEKDAP